MNIFVCVCVSKSKTEIEEEERERVCVILFVMHVSIPLDYPTFENPWVSKLTGSTNSS